jgi:ADP-ribose pyrophosphatase YjhB (NUDIX family)
MSRRDRASFQIAVDLVILTIRAGALSVLLVERGQEPFEGRFALPGGFLREGEDLLAAAVRELREETGLEGLAAHLEQVHAYASPGRDPRGRIASVAYLAILPDLPAPVAGTDAAAAAWVPLGPGGAAPVGGGASPGGLAFDHDEILRDAVERARGRLENTPLATAFCGEHFTISDLRTVYEAVWGVALDQGNFHRKVTGMPGFVVPTGDVRYSSTGRPATLYRRGPAEVLTPPLLRPPSGGIRARTPTVSCPPSATR